MPRDLVKKNRRYNFFLMGVGIVKVMEWGLDLDGTG
jgi:hypothetical protein